LGTGFVGTFEEVEAHEQRILRLAAQTSGVGGHFEEEQPRKSAEKTRSEKVPVQSPSTHTSL
jgi:hypothetical protein